MTGNTHLFEVFQDRRGQFRWRIIDRGGLLIGAASEGFATREECEENMNRGGNHADRWDFYIDRRGAFRWRRYARNGRVVAAASRGFSSRAEAEENARYQGYGG